MEAIVLAGGMGTRLRAVVADVPKPLAPVAGRPFLSYVLDRLAAHGVTRVILSVGYMHEKIRAAFGDAYRGMDLVYVVEDEPLGTGGAVRLALRAARKTHVIVVNGDTYVEAPYAELLECTRAANADFGMALVPVENTARYGRVSVEHDRVVGFHEKGESGPGLINGGVYALRKDLLEQAHLPEKFSLETDVLMRDLDTLHPVAVTAGGLFIDIGIPEDFARAQDLFAGFSA